MTTVVTAQALQKLLYKSWEGNPEKESLEATLENRHRGADVTCWGRLFQVRAAATGKVR